MRARREKAAGAAAIIMTILMLTGILTAAQGEERMKFDNRLAQRVDPRPYDLAQAQAAGLSDGREFTDEYFTLQAFYGQALFAWLDDRLELRQTDEAIGQLPIGLTPAAEPASGFRSCQSYGMRYLFIRSWLCIERMDADSLDALRRAEAEGTPPEDEAMRELVESTWMTVTCHDPLAPGNASYILDLTDGTAVPCASLLIGFEADPAFDADGSLRDPAQAAEGAAVMEEMAPALSRLFSQRLAYPVRVVITR